MGSVTGTYEMVVHFRNFVDRPCTTSDYTSEKSIYFLLKDQVTKLDNCCPMSIVLFFKSTTSPPPRV